MGGFGGLFAWTVIPTVLVGGVLRMFVFEPWLVPTDEWLNASTAPTLDGGDHVLLLTVGTPSVGELVRCKDPEEPSAFVVGRIVGKGGDIIEIGTASLKVNGHGYYSSNACAERGYTVMSPESQQRLDLVCGRVEFAGGWHFIGRVPKAKTEPSKTFKVEPGKYFLVSDNRDIHDDSRDFGAVQAELCDRRIAFRLWGAKGWTDSKRRLTLVR
ncbi:MAG: signal peptidase I [Deltaproteobacteria bacterium]|nr:signal peptidase I [Deltaproteobacteria bacterium]